MQRTFVFLAIIQQIAQVVIKRKDLFPIRFAFKGGQLGLDERQDILGRCDLMRFDDGISGEFILVSGVWLCIQIVVIDAVDVAQHRVKCVKGFSRLIRNQSMGVQVAGIEVVLVVPCQNSLPIYDALTNGIVPSAGVAAR